MEFLLISFPEHFTLKQFRNHFELSLPKVAKILGISVIEAKRIDHAEVTFTMLSQLITGLGFHTSILVTPVPIPVDRIKSL